MRNLINKEFRLSTMVLTYVFLSFALMTFLPGYPILCGTFFVCLGMFQSYQMSREANDIMYSVMLPVRKRDVVKAKYAAAVILELAAFVLCVICTIVRMTALADADIYVQNMLMPANPVFLGFVLLIFASFNCVFIGGFFRTAYQVGKPFILFVAVNFVIIGIGETLHHIPGLEVLGYAKGGVPAVQFVIFACGVLVFAGVTLMSCRRSQKRFEMIDL